MSEPLFVCPCCQTAGFTAVGLHRHQCHAKPDRARLTLVEIANAPAVAAPTLKPLRLAAAAKSDQP